MTGPTKTKCPTRRPISVWDLPKLATSVHEFRKPNVSSPKFRPHYIKILAFVYRNRFAIADQVQRRIPEYLTSARTTRRHLAEMESLGLLAVQPVNGVSPLMPKVYSVTAAGLQRLRKAYEKIDLKWQPLARERRRPEGQSFPHVFHELAITEFLLAVREAVDARPDLELVVNERRSLVNQPAFQFAMAGQRTQLRPDALFQFRQARGGSMCCFVEVDTGTESERQLSGKLKRYRLWGDSQQASDFLCGLYREAGARRPKPKFRILFVSSSSNAHDAEHRLDVLARLAAAQSPELRSRIWITGTHCLSNASAITQSMRQPIWFCARDGDPPTGALRIGLRSLFPEQSAAG